VPDIDAETFAAGLADHRYLLATQVKGVYGRGQDFEEIGRAFDELVSREVAPDGAERVRFPPVLPREHLERSGYLSSFPHLAGAVFSFSGTERDAVELGERAARHEDWSAFQRMTDVALLPAACYPVYPWVAAAGPLPAEGRLVDVCSYCFRHEPSDDPTRMQAFRMREHVRIGSADDVVAWHQHWLERGRAVLRGIGLETEIARASDPFFGRAGKLLSANQREQGLKYELVHPICSADAPTAIVSVNSHLDHFGLDFGIRTAAGETAYTACVGFGIERIVLALLRTHGLDHRRWPDAVRLRLWPEAGV
jgi:seryl-tRNA synthetase